MRIFILLGCLTFVLGQDRKSVTCSDGTAALARGNKYCCIEDGLEYCCMQNDPYHCVRPSPSQQKPYSARANENETPDMIIAPPFRPVSGMFTTPRPGTFESTTSCRGLSVTRTASAPLTMKGQFSLYTIAISQSEGCGAPETMAVRLSGVEAGRTYSVMVGESIACGGDRDRAWEVARVTIQGRVGSVEVPSTVKSVRELRGLTVSLTTPMEQGPPITTYGCGVLVVL